MIASIFIIVMKILDKSLSEIVDFAVFHSNLVFLFALCYLGMASSANNKKGIDGYRDIVDNATGDQKTIASNSLNI